MPQLVTEIGRLHMENLELRALLAKQDELIAALRDSDEPDPRVPAPVDGQDTVEPAKAAPDGPD